MRNSPLRKLPGGGFAITLCVPPEIAAFAERECRERGYVDAEDLLSCVLNTAMFEVMEAEPPPPVHGFDGIHDDIPF